jgi:hypothetical protein
MSKQTAVEFFVEQLIIDELIDVIDGHQFLHLQSIAKEMEKEQMWEYIKKNYCIGPNSLEFHRLEFEQYYNETYKKEDK